MRVITESTFFKHNRVCLFKWAGLFFIPFMSTYFKWSTVYESQSEKQSIDQIMQQKFSQV